MVTECPFGILQLIPCVSCPVGSLRYPLVLLMVVIPCEQRFTVGFKVSLEEVVSLREVLFPDEVSTSEIQVGTQLVKQFCMVFTVTRSHPTLLIRSCVQRVQLFGDAVEPACQIEEGRRIVLLLEIQFLISGLILFGDSLKPRQKDFLIRPVCRVFLQQVGHQFLRLVEVLATLDIRPCLTELFFLSPQARCYHEQQEKQRYRLLPLHLRILN